MSEKTSLNCVWAQAGIALHNSGRSLLCCHSRTYLQDPAGNDIYWHTHDLDDAWKSPTRWEIQKSLSQGQQHPNCQACWDEENAGRPSRRQEHNRINHYIVPGPNVPRLIDLKLGNTCNLACRHCWPEVSSRWINDYYEINVKTTGVSKKDYLRRWDSIQLSYDRENHKLWDKLRNWMVDIEYIDIFGAEPMLLPRLFDILEHSVVSGMSQKQKLHINTNATIWNQKYIDTLSKFQHAQIDLSIDGIGAHFDYIRHGETWDTVDRNIELYKDLQTRLPNVSVAVCVTVCALNVLYIGQLFEYFCQKGMTVFTNLVHIPEYLNIRCLPNDVKSQIVQHLQQERPIPQYARLFLTQIANFMQMPHADSHRHWMDFCRKTDQIDHLRSQEFQTTFPEMWQLAKPHWTNNK